jgi:hypothetical protein
MVEKTGFSERLLAVEVGLIADGAVAVQAGGGVCVEATGSDLGAGEHPSNKSKPRQMNARRIIS